MPMRSWRTWRTSGTAPTRDLAARCRPVGRCPGPLLAHGGASMGIRSAFGCRPGRSLERAGPSRPLPLRQPCDRHCRVSAGPASARHADSLRRGRPSRPGPRRPNRPARALGLDDAFLRQPWKHMRDIERRRPSCWDFVAATAPAGCHGLRVPSGGSCGTNLVLWRWNDRGVLSSVRLMRLEISARPSLLVIKARIASLEGVSYTALHTSRLYAISHTPSIKL